MVTALAEPLRQIANDMDKDELRQHLANAVAGHHGMTYGVYDRPGNTTYATPGPDLSKLASSKKLVNRITADDLTVWQENQRSYRGVALQLPADDSAAPGYRTSPPWTSAFISISWQSSSVCSGGRPAFVLCIALGVAWLA